MTSDGRRQRIITTSARVSGVSDLDAVDEENPVHISTTLALIAARTMGEIEPDAFSNVWRIDERPRSASAADSLRVVELRRGGDAVGEDARMSGAEFPDDAVVRDHQDYILELPEAITPGAIPVVLWRGGGEDKAVMFDFEFTWDGRRKANWSYDISMLSDDLSPASSSPIFGTADWTGGTDVELTYESSDFELDDTSVLTGMAPADGELPAPQTWISLARCIADFIDELIC